MRTESPETRRLNNASYSPSILKEAKRLVIREKGSNCRESFKRHLVGREGAYLPTVCIISLG